MASIRLAVLLILLLTFPASALLVGPGAPVPSQSIASISLSNNSFTGGASNGTTIGTVTVTMSPASPAFTGTLSVTGAQTGSGNDGSSFAFSGASLQTNTSGGTDQPGTYSINIVATQAGTTNGTLTQAETISASGTGGSGYQLAFSDEFNGTELENIVTQPMTSMTWASTNGGQIAVVLPSATTISAIGQDVSISGATNAGSGSSTLINGTFVVSVFTDSQHFTITNSNVQVSSGVISGIGIGSATLGTGPWATTLGTSCSGTPGGACSGLPRNYFNNGTAHGWNPANCVETGGSLQIISTAPSGGWTDPLGTNHTYADCHIEASGAGSSQQFSQLYGIFETRAQMPAGPGLDSGMWMGGIDGYWPYGGEIDYPEYLVGSAGQTPTNPTIEGLNVFNATTGGGGNLDQYNIGTDMSLAYHDYQINWTSGSVAFSTDGTNVYTMSTSADVPSADAMFPIADVETGIAGRTGSPSGNLPATYYIDFVRVWKPVASNACYAAPVAATVIPHTGTC